ncbi:hypothetical protein MP228_011698 [Amoeboaphelidium protococcarum]|nr:hypothetical protein MP228_011698 [Amoeboaphelidium protococcarum]
MLLSFVVSSFLTVSTFAIQLRKFDHHSGNIACGASNSHANLHLNGLLSRKSLSYLESIGEESQYLIDQFGPQSVYQQQYLEHIYKDAPQQLNTVIEESLLKLHRLLKASSDVDVSVIQIFACQEFGVALPLHVSNHVIQASMKEFKELSLPLIKDGSYDRKQKSRSLQKRQHDENSMRRLRAIVGFVELWIGGDMVIVATSLAQARRTHQVPQFASYQP